MKTPRVCSLEAKATQSSCRPGTCPGSQDHCVKRGESGQAECSGLSHSPAHFPFLWLEQGPKAPKESELTQSSPGVSRLQDPFFLPLGEIR